MTTYTIGLEEKKEGGMEGGGRVEERYDRFPSIIMDIIWLCFYYSLCANIICVQYTGSLQLARPSRPRIRTLEQPQYAH